MAESTQGTDTPATAPINVPDKPALEGLEAALTQRWLAEGTYKFNPDTNREQVYSIDTPPPTASGSLHVGHGRQAALGRSKVHQALLALAYGAATSAVVTLAFQEIFYVRLP